MRRGSNWQDIVLRALILLSGVVAAVLLILRGDAQVLPALAIGSAVGACLVGFSERLED